MPQDDPHTERDSARRQRGGSSSAEQMRGEAAAAAETMSARMADIGTNSFNVGLRMQTEMFDTLQTIGHQWFERKTHEAELAFNLPNRLAGARTLPDAMSAYQEWLSELLAMCNEDGRRFVSDGQKIVATGVRCFTDISPSAPG
jgi:hypothetical protein